MDFTGSLLDNDTQKNGRIPSVCVFILHLEFLVISVVLKYLPSRDSRRRLCTTTRYSRRHRKVAGSARHRVGESVMRDGGGGNSHVEVIQLTSNFSRVHSPAKRHQQGGEGDSKGHHGRTSQQQRKMTTIYVENVRGDGEFGHLDREERNHPVQGFSKQLKLQIDRPFCF